MRMTTDEEQGPVLTKLALNSSAMRVRRRGAESTCEDVREVEVVTENRSGNQVTLSNLIVINSSI